LATVKKRKSINVGTGATSIVGQKKSKHTNRAAMKKEKGPSKTPKRTNIFSTVYHYKIMPTMRQKKKKSILKLFHPQNKTTENLNLRIKEATLKIRPQRRIEQRQTDFRLL
jgi:hypothetical protein